MSIRLRCPDCQATFQVDRVTFETCPGCDARLIVQTPPRRGIGLLTWSITSLLQRPEPTTRSQYLHAAANQGLLAGAMAAVAAGFLADRAAWAAVPRSAYAVVIAGVAAGLLSLRSVAFGLYFLVSAPRHARAPVPPSPPKDLDLILPDDP